jgi:lipopolysaccharide biosynthesis glycosyltransferase
MAGAPIHVALTFDDSFWAPAYATMRSVCLASRRREDLRFHVLTRGVSAEHRQVLGAIETEFGARLIDYDLTNNPAVARFLEGLSFHKKLTNLVYTRLMLDELLPAEVERIIYLDCDMLVRAPIEQLAEADLEGKALAAVMDPHRHRAMLGRDFLRNADLFDYRQPYFNAGMLVIDRAAFGAADLPARTRAYHEQGVLGRVQYDQAILNLVFAGNWLELDFRWNLINPSPAHEVLEPHIVHYTGPRKPWQMLPGIAFAQVYRHTMTNAVYYRYMRERAWRRIGLSR